MAHPPSDNHKMQYYYYFKQQYIFNTHNQDISVLETMRREWEDMANSPFQATFEGLHSWGSQAHGYGMFPAYFLSAYVLGVRLNGPVQQILILIEPRLGDLTLAKGTVVTEFGPINVIWEKRDEIWHFRIDCDVKAKIILRIPDSQFLTINGQPAVNAKDDGRSTEVEVKSGTTEGSFFRKLY
jgi:hypothetical protein